MAAARIYEVLAGAFAAEGVDTTFALMGNGNMHWLYDMAKRHGVRNIHVRHEHCAVAMAEGYARATGRVGVAAVSAGPAYTQIITGLTAAARARMPVVVLAGEAPIHAAWHAHRIDQPALTAPTGAHYIQLHSADRMLGDVREAFHLAQAERRTVVLGIPEDMLKAEFGRARSYEPAAGLTPTRNRLQPDPAVVERIAALIGESERPIVLGGRGAVWAGAGRQLVELADSCGALLSNTMLAAGLFDDHPFSLGIAGGYATALAQEQFAACDLVLAFGASLAHHATEGGKLFPKARVVQVDTRPTGLSQGLRTADIHLQADAAAGAQAILVQLNGRAVGTGLRTNSLARRIATEPPDPREFPASPDTVDPRRISAELNSAVPRDWEVVCGSAHFTGFVIPHLRGRPPERLHVASDFGAIGQALANAIGVAAARGDGKVLLVEGDGSLLMHIQELDTIRRHGLRLLICVMNDGAFGAEAQKFRAQGLDPAEATHGRGNLADVARAFGLRGRTVTRAGLLADLFRDHEHAAAPELWDLQVDERIPSPHYQRLHFGHA